MFKVSPSQLVGRVDSITSKSYAHRALIMATLADKPTVLYGQASGIDMLSTINALQMLGADIEDHGNSYKVKPITEFNKDMLINVKESGSTLRFLLPLVAVLGVSCTITGEGRLSERPNEALIEALHHAGAVIEGETLPLTVSGAARANEITVRADISSQYVSGLLMAMQTMPYPSYLSLEGELKSKNYVDITIDCMRRFGVNVEYTADGYRLPGGGFHSPKIYFIEGDWSNSAFWLVAGAINGRTKVDHLNINSFQGDKEIINILKKANAIIVAGDRSVEVISSILTAFEYDMENYPDLVPITAVLASRCRGTSILHSVDRLRLKESDRIESTLNMLHAFNIKAEYRDSSLIIEGGKPIGGNVVDGANDHRIVMSATILAACSEKGATITDENAVNKSYQGFLNDFASLGGKADA